MRKEEKKSWWFEKKVLFSRVLENCLREELLRFFSKTIIEINLILRTGGVALRSTLPEDGQEVVHMLAGACISVLDQLLAGSTAHIALYNLRVAYLQFAILLNNARTVLPFGVGS